MYILLLVKIIYLQKSTVQGREDIKCQPAITLFVFLVCVRVCGWGCVCLKQIRTPVENLLIIQ